MKEGKLDRWVFLHSIYFTTMLPLPASSSNLIPDALMNHQYISMTMIISIYLCFASFFQERFNLKCHFLNNFFRFLMWKLKTCPTKQDLVYSTAVPVYALQLLKPVRKTERFVTFHRFFCCFHLLTFVWFELKKRQSR